MNYKILIVEDEKSISDMLGAYFEKEGFDVDYAYDGMEAIGKFQNFGPHILVLDRMLPSISGDQVCEEIRKLSQVPVLMLTAKTDEESRLEGFELGADDYVTKPFSIREIVFRVKALLKRSYPLMSDYDFDDGHLKMDFAKQLILVKDEEVKLTANEIQILEALIKHKLNPLSRAQLVDYAFGYDYDAFERNIDTYIKNIRQKIEKNPKEPEYIVTKYGVGYLFGKM